MASMQHPSSAETCTCGGSGGVYPHCTICGRPKGYSAPASTKRMRTVHDLPQPFRAVAWAVGYALLLCLSVGAGILAGLEAFSDDWKGTREQLKQSRKRGQEAVK